MSGGVAKDTSGASQMLFAIFFTVLIFTAVVVNTDDEYQY